MQTDVELAQTTLAILAGGMGRRMGLPKAQLRLAGRPILEYLLEQFAWAGPTLLITAPGLENPPGGGRFDREATDPVAGDGPLRGVLTAMQASTTPTTVILTVDMPCVRNEQLRWMLDRLHIRKACLGLMLTRMIEGEESIEPFPFVCRSAAAIPIAVHLKAGGRAVHKILDETNFAKERAPELWPLSSWTNLNRPEELDRFLNVKDFPGVHPA